MDLLEQVAQGFAELPVAAPLREQALAHLRRWLTEPVFAPYRPQLEWLIQTRQWAGLFDRFARLISFGTGGCRGPMGIGPNRLNPWTLGILIQGHCQYLRERFPGRQPLRVVLGYDVRRFTDQARRYHPQLPHPVRQLSSRDFAEQAAGVYVANGIEVYLLPEGSPRYLATPELSFTIRFLGAQGGANISASHNPPDDGGVKFYDERGAQPVPPDDQILADLMASVTEVRQLDWPAARRSGLVHWLEETPHRAYVELCRRQSLVAPPRFDELRLVFTPLHGVGSGTVLEVLTTQGFRVTPVAEQMPPDGRFPQVSGVPNPELADCWDRAQALAQQEEADLVLASDPDADRLGALIPTPTGEWRLLTGHEIGALLAHFKLSQLAARKALPASPIVLTTLVTSRQISRIARAFGAQVIDNLLVGFKYVAAVLAQLEDQGRFGEVVGTPADFLLAVEESLGFLLVPQIRDKDAAAAALLLAEAALEEKRQGRRLYDYLQRLAREFGYFHHELHTLPLPGLAEREEVLRQLDQLRRRPPTQLAGLAVTEFLDLLREDIWLGPLQGPTDAAARNFLVFELGARGRIAVRPSGTEPKLKVYVETCTPACPPHTPAAVWQSWCQEADELARRLVADFQCQLHHGASAPSQVTGGVKGRNDRQGSS
jgi:phosphoglucomutase